MFGKTMNTFERWPDRPSKYEVAVVAQWAAEIRKLHEGTIPNALENINKAQEIQKINQDKQSRVIDEPLKIGSHVFLKFPSLVLGKLKPESFEGMWFFNLRIMESLTDVLLFLLYIISSSKNEKLILPFKQMR